MNPPPPLRALTLHRPWARCVVEWDKPVENRSWPAPASMIGRHLAIHAGKTWDYDGSEFIRDLRSDVALDGGSHPSGVIVGVVRVAGCARVQLMGVFPEKYTPKLTLVSGTFGSIPVERMLPWCFGPFAWLLDELVAIQPVPCRGKQGLWPVPPDVLPLVRERWRIAKEELHRTRVLAAIEKLESEREAAAK